MSLKRFGDAGRADQRSFDSDYFLTRAEVDQYADVVKKRSSSSKGKKGKKGRKRRRKNAGHKKANDTDEEEESDEDVELETSVPEPLRPNGHWMADTIAGLAPKAVEGMLSECVKRWKANADDSHKGMFSCFDESGIFIAVCCHHIMLVVCDMVASGEL